MESVPFVTQCEYVGDNCEELAKAAAAAGGLAVRVVTCGLFALRHKKLGVTARENDASGRMFVAAVTGVDG